jgi:hypothetical protein
MYSTFMSCLLRCRAGGCGRVETPALVEGLENILQYVFGNILRRQQCRYSWILYSTVNEILVFGRETGFPTQTLQRWYMYKSPQEMETNLINFNKSCYLVLIFDSHSQRLLLSLLSYPDVNTIWNLFDKKFVGISKIPENTASAQIQGF